MQFLSAPDDISYTLKLQGYDQGNFSLDVDKQEGNTITEYTSFQGIPSSTSTVATMDITPDFKIVNASLKIDKNSDGVIDFNLISKLNGIVTMPKYIFSGFLQPIDVKYHPEQTPSISKGGSTIPVKFQLKNLNGAITEAEAALIWLPPVQENLTSAKVDESVHSFIGTSGSTFKWDSTNQQYIYNWSTKGLKSGYWYKIYVQLDDGYVYSVNIGLK